MSFPIANHLWQGVADWSDAWGRWMLVGLFQGIVSALLVGAILWFGRRRLTAPLRYSLLFLLLVKLAAPPLPGFPIGVFTWFHADWAQRSETSVAERPVSSDVEPTRESLAPFLKSEEPAVNSENQPVPKPSVVRSSAIPEPLPDDAAKIPADALPPGDTVGNIAATTSPPLSDAIRAASEVEGVPAEPRASSSSFSLTAEEPAAISGFVGEALPWRQWIMLAHIGGFLAFVVAIGLGHWRMVRRAHRSSLVQLSARWVEVLAGATAKLGCRPARLVISPRIETPCVAGWWRPTIYLPAWAGDLDAAQRTALVAHELAHVCRWDHWLAPVQSLLVAWLWWNPLAWYVGRRIRRERECCCDDFVLARDCCEPRLYAELLVNTMARTSFVRWTAAWGLRMAEAVEPVADRLERIMEPGPRVTHLRRIEFLLTAVAAMLLLPSLPRRVAPAAEPSTEVAQVGVESIVGPHDGAASEPGDSATESDVAAPSSERVPDLVEPAAYELKLIVRDKSGQPVPKAEVTVEFGDGQNWPYGLALVNGRWPMPRPGVATKIDGTQKATTGDDGQAVVRWESRHASCAVLVSVQKAGFRSVTQSPLALEPFGATSTTLGPGVIEPGTHVAATPTLARREDCAEFRGRVADEASGQPVKSAVLADVRFDAFYQGAFLERRFEPIGADGSFALNIDVRGAERRLMARTPPVVLADGYPVQVGTWELADGTPLQWADPSLAQHAGKEIGDVRVKVKRGVQFAARVVRAGGEPVPGARALWLHAGQTLVFDGDDQGKLTIGPVLRPEEMTYYFFDVTWPGFTRSHTVSLRPGDPVPEMLEIKLPATRTVRGRLVDDQDRPVTRARIFTGYTPGNVPVPLRDWPDGQFTVDAATTDTRFGSGSQPPPLVSVDAPGFAVAVVSVNQPDEPVTIRLSPGKPVGGRVLDASGKPIAGVMIANDFLGPMNPPTVKLVVRTDATGVFWFTHFPTDVTASFSVMHPDHTNLRRQEFTPGKVDHQLTLASPLVVAGRVVDEVTDEQLGRVMVQQGTTGSGHTTWRFQRPVAYDDGRFEMKFNEVPANAVLRILADGFQPLVLQPPINQYGKPDQVFGLKRSHPISLRVLTNEGQPAKDFVVEVHSAAEEDLTRLQTAVRDRRMKLIDVAGPIAAALDASGRARITKAPDGKHLITVYDATATPVYEEEIEVGPALATKEYVVRIVPQAKPAAVAKTPPAAPTKSTAAPAAARVGNILLRATRDGKPLAGAQVGLIPRPGYRSERNGRTGDDGTFLFGGLNPGLYDVQLFDGFIFVGSQQLTRMQRSVRVRVDPDKTVEVLALGGPGTSLDGKLVDSQGKPVPGTFTLLTYLGSQLPLGERGAATACPFARAAAEPPGADAGPTLATMTLHTDSDGKFSAPELAPGFYQAMFRRNPAGTTDQDFEWHTHFEIKPGKPRVALQFQPQPGPRLRPGEPAPELVGAEAGGEKSLARLRGRVVVLDFWGSWNKPSIAGLATMRQLQEKFAGRDVVVLGVNLDETLDAMNQAVSQHGVGWPQVHVAPEKAGHVLDQFGVRALPERFVIGKDGRVVRAGVDDDELVAAVEEAMKP